MKLESSRQILKNSQTSNFTEIHSVRAKLFRADGQTDRQDTTKLTVALHNFANVPKNYHKQFVAPSHKEWERLI
jgi:ubiquitin C-terminal hydrolase